MSDGKDTVTASPDGGDAVRATMREVAASLRELHLGLVEFARGEYEREHGSVGGAGEMLKLLLHDPAFDWMRALSTLMVDVDELLDGEDLTTADAAAVRGEIETLITQPDGVSQFSRHYLEALQSDPSVVMAHAAVRRSLAVLPAAARAETPVAPRTEPAPD